MKQVCALLIVGTSLVSLIGVRGESASAIGDDAAALYKEADQDIVADSTASYWDATHFTPGPPYDPTQLHIAADEWKVSKHVRDLCRQARLLQHAKWTADFGGPFMVRGLTSNLADAALYADDQGDHAYAMEVVRDLLHFADLMRSPES